MFIDVDIGTARARRFEREDGSSVRHGGGLSERDMQSFWDDVLAPGVETLVPLARAEADVVLRVDASQRLLSAVVRDERVDVIAVLDGAR